MNQQAQLYVYSFDRLVWCGLVDQKQSALCQTKILSPGLSSMVEQWLPPSPSPPSTSWLSFSSEADLQCQCLAKMLHIVTLLHPLLDPKPEYFFSWNNREQFLGSRSWRFRMTSFEKSIVVLLLEHQTFLELNSFFFSMSEIFMYKLDFFSMNIP